MRNQKRPSRKNVRFKPGIFIFALGLLGSIFVGGYGRYWLESQSLDQKVQAVLSANPEFPVQVEGVRFQFRRGWLPAFALSAESLTAADQSCKDRNLVARGIFVPMALLPLLKGQVKARRMAVEALVATFPKDCRSGRKDGGGAVQNKASSTTEVSNSSSSKASSDKNVAKRIVPQKIFAFYDDLLKNSPLPRLDIQDLQLFVVDKDVTELQVHGKLNLRILEKSANFLLQINEAWVFGEELPVNRGRLDIDMSQQRLAVNLESRLREGRLNVKLDFENDSEVKTSLKLDVAKLPISLLTPFVLESARLRYLWLDCQIEVSAGFQKFYQTPFPLNSCVAGGPYGQVTMQSDAMTLEKPEGVSISIDNLDLDQILQKKRDVYFSGVFAKYGIFSGDLAYENSKSWEFHGHLEKSEVLFSRNSRREVQGISKLPLAVTFEDSKVSILLENVGLDGGTFDGKVRMDLNSDLQSGKVNVELKQIALHEKIYQLMLKSEKSPFSFFGEFSLRDGRPDTWTGVVTTPELKSKEIVLESVKMESLKKSGDAPTVVFSAAKGSFALDGPLRDWLMPTVLGAQWPTSPLAFEGFSVGLEKSLATDGKESSPWQWKWQKGRLAFANGWQLSSHGKVLENKSLEGWVQWDIPRSAPLRWAFAGDWGGAQWTPSEPWMIQWLRQHPDFLLKHPKVNYSVPSEKSADIDSKVPFKKTTSKTRRSVQPIFRDQNEEFSGG